MTNAEFVDGLVADRAFRDAFADRLRGAPGAAYCWETPRWTRATMAEPFRSALVDSPALARAVADPGPFREHFTDAPCAVFPSLGGDALLLAPCPRGGDPAPYAHLAAFVRGAPPDQVDALLQRLGELVRDRVASGRPVWVSTAGLGVSWLHVRLDDRPKYYRTAAFR